MTYSEKLDLEEAILHIGAGGRILSKEEQEQKLKIINERRSWLELPDKLCKALSEHSKQNNKGRFL